MEESFSRRHPIEISASVGKNQVVRIIVEFGNCSPASWIVSGEVLSEKEPVKILSPLPESWWWVEIGLRYVLDMLRLESHDCFYINHRNRRAMNCRHTTWGPVYSSLQLIHRKLHVTVLSTPAVRKLPGRKIIFSVFAVFNHESRINDRFIVHDSEVFWTYLHPKKLDNSQQ